MKIDSTNPEHWLLLLQQCLYTMLAIGARFVRKKSARPLVILYGHQLSGNLKALYYEWLRHYQTDMDLFFLSLDPTHSAELEQGGIRVLRCNRILDMLKLGQASAMITDHGLHMMTPLLWFTDIIFIDVWHGIPFKGFVPQDFALQHRYDESWVSSPLLKTLYEVRFGFPRGKVVSIGYARTDQLFKSEKMSSSAKAAIKISPLNKVVLYAPTWQQDDKGRELFPFGLDRKIFLSQLNKICGQHGAILVVRSHINADISEKSYDNVRYCSQRDFPDTESLLADSDILICDWSSIAFDNLALRRTTIFLDVAPPFKNGFSLDQSYRFGKVVSDMPSLCEHLRIYLQDSEQYQIDCGVDQERVISAVYGDNIDGKSAQRQLDRLLDKLY